MPTRAVSKQVTIRKPLRIISKSLALKYYDALPSKLPDHLISISVLLVAFISLEIIATFPISIDCPARSKRLLPHMLAGYCSIDASVATCAAQTGCSYTSLQILTTSRKLYSGIRLNKRRKKGLGAHSQSTL